MWSIALVAHDSLHHATASILVHAALVWVCACVYLCLITCFGLKRVTCNLLCVLLQVEFVLCGSTFDKTWKPDLMVFSNAWHSCGHFCKLVWIISSLSRNMYIFGIKLFRPLWLSKIYTLMMLYPLALWVHSQSQWQCLWNLLNIAS